MTEQHHPREATADPGRPRRLFRWLILILLVVIVTPVAIVGFRAQQQLAFIRDVEQRNGDIDTERWGPGWFRNLIGDEQMRGFESMTHVVVEDVRDEDLQFLARKPLPRTLILVNPQWTDTGVRELSNFDGLFELGFWRVQQQREQMLQELSRFRSLTKLSFFETKLADEDLKALSSLKSLKTLMIMEGDVAGTGLRHLRDLPELRFLNVGTNPLTDDGLAALEELTQVDFLLSLAHSEITDDGLAHVKPLTRVRRLVLANTQITDAGLESLSEMTELQSLELNNTAITDAGLSKLYHLSKLQELDLTGTQVTPDGMQMLQAALPSCLVTHDSLP